MSAVTKGRPLRIEGGNLYFKFHKDVQILESTTTHNQMLNKYIVHVETTSNTCWNGTCNWCCLVWVSVVSSSSILAAVPGSGSNVGVGVSRNSGPDAGPGGACGKASGEQSTLGQKTLAQQIPGGQGQECDSCGIRNDQALNVKMCPCCPHWLFFWKIKSWSPVAAVRLAVTGSKGMMGAGAGVTSTTKAARRNTRVRLCEGGLEGYGRTSFF